MSKNIVVCADGTWNRPTVHTNVDRLFNTLPGSPSSVHAPPEIGQHITRQDPAQMSFYLEGVGTKASRNDLLAGATGTGLHRKVLDGYILISRNYVPGDKIFLFGFSRGAYTVRSLAALIAKAGLLGVAEANASNCRVLANQRWRFFKDMDKTSPPVAPDATDPHPIRLVGVWDTVGALGIPAFNGVTVIDAVEGKLFDFANLDLSERVEFGLHAMAIDERRKDFEPTPWSPRHGVTQLWFPGVHSDVGGGYHSHALANSSLLWMLTEATKPAVGLVATIPALSLQPLANRHESADFLIWKIGSRPREIPSDALFHQCVSERFTGRADYRPQALAHHPLFAAFYTPPIPAEIVFPNDPADNEDPIQHLAVGESLTTTVLAEKWWNAVGLRVEAGEGYEVTSSGMWNDATQHCDATGWEGYPWLTRYRRVPEKNWFYLCMAVSPEDRLEFENAHFFKGLFGKVKHHDSHSAIYPVGCSQHVSITAPGFVYFFANDLATHYGNNLGYLDVTIKRV
jgi:hypothetical protein